MLSYTHTFSPVITEVLEYHLLPQSYCSAAILGPVRQRSLHGKKVNLTCDVNDSLRVNGVPVTASDIVGINGVVHVIDKLLIPPEGTWGQGGCGGGEVWNLGRKQGFVKVGMCMGNLNFKVTQHAAWW